MSNNGPNEDKPYVPPIPLAFLLCDTVIIDKESDKISLIGLFSGINAEKFPVTHQKWGLYFLGEDVTGELDISFECIKSDSQDILMTGSARTAHQEKKRLQIAMNLPPLTFPEPGDYEIHLYINERYVNRVKFSATLLRKE